MHLVRGQVVGSQAALEFAVGCRYSYSRRDPSVAEIVTGSRQLRGLSPVCPSGYDDECAVWTGPGPRCDM